MDNKLIRLLLSALLVLLGVISALFVADWAGSAATYASTTAVIDEKTEDVLKLTASASLASFGASAIPGDTATPIAAKLADFSEYFLLILTVLYAEKYLLSLIGLGVFRVLIPASCLLGILALNFWRQGWRLAVKLFLTGLLLFALIPSSFSVSNLIYGAYRESIDGTISAAETLSDETAPLADATEDKGTVQAILDRLSETTASLTDKAVDAVNRFVETLAVMIVTSCVIPLLVLLFFLWVIRQLTGVDLSASLPRPRAVRRPDEPRRQNGQAER